MAQSPKLRFAAFHLVQYHARSRTSIPVTRLVERDDLIKIYVDEDQEEEQEAENGGEHKGNQETRRRSRRIRGLGAEGC